MSEIRNLTCIVCPLGCNLDVSLESGKVEKVEGNGCKRGIAYAQAECTNPTRMLTTTVKVKDGKSPLVSVKSDKPLSKNLVLDCMDVINSVKLITPVHIGDIVVENIIDTGVNIIATSNTESIAENAAKDCRLAV